MSDSPQRSSEYSILNRLEFQFLPRQLKQWLWVWIKIQWLLGRTWVRLCFLHVEAGREQTPETWPNTERLPLASPKSSHYDDKHSLKHNQRPPQDSKPSTHKGSHEMKVKWCPIRETRLCLPQHGKGARTRAFPWFFSFLLTLHNSVTISIIAREHANLDESYFFFNFS